MEVKCATSFDERFDPNNVLNKDPNKFWITTGLYPQEILIDLGGTKPVNEVKFIVSGARKIVIEGCKTTNASEFKKVGESKDLLYFQKLLHAFLFKVDTFPLSIRILLSNPLLSREIQYLIYHAPYVYSDRPFEEQESIAKACTQEISVDEYKKQKSELGEQVVLLDMRGENPLNILKSIRDKIIILGIELREGNPKGEQELVNWYEERIIKFTKGDKEKLVVVMTITGGRGAIWVQRALGLGFSNTKNLRGGFYELEKSGYKFPEFEVVENYKLRNQRYPWWFNLGLFSLMIILLLLNRSL